MIYLRKFEKIFVVTIFLVMVVLFAFNVVTREIGGTVASQFTWIEEAVRYLNIFLVFGALGLALEKGRHVAIDTLRESLPPRLKFILRKLIDLVGCIFTAYIAYLGFLLAQFILNTGQRSPTLDIPVGWLYVAPILGFALLCLRYGLSFFSQIDRWSRHQDVSEPTNEDITKAGDAS